MGVIETAWAAGLFEGEGCITSHGRSLRQKRPTLSVQLSTTDEDVARRFMAAVGRGALVGPRYRANYKPIWRWNAYSDDARIVLYRLWAFLGDRRRARATELWHETVNTKSIPLPASEVFTWG